MSNDDAHSLTFTPEALEVIKSQLSAIAAIQSYYGTNSSQYLRMLETWSQCMSNIIRLGGSIQSDGGLDLIGQSQYLVYGMNFHKSWESEEAIGYHDESFHFGTWSINS